MDEIWRTSVSVDSYEISTHGRVRHGTSGEIRKLQSNFGHPHVNLFYTIGGVKFTKGVTVSKEVLSTYVNEIDEGGRREYARHIDGDISNNYLQNLEWSCIPPPRVMGVVNVDYDSPSPDAEIITMKFGQQEIDVSSDGFIRSDRVRWRSGAVEQGRYYKRVTVQFDRDGKYKESRHEDIHFLVSHAFLGPRPEGYVIDHIDTDKQNNSISNLEYVTRSGNQLRSIANGNAIAPNQKPVDQYTLDGEYITTYCNQSDASMAMIGKTCGSAAIGQVCNGIRDHYKKHTWRHFGDPFERVSIKRKPPTDNGVFIGKLMEDGELCMTADGKFIVKIGSGDMKRPRTGKLRGMVYSKFSCDEHDELRKFLVSHVSLIGLRSTARYSKDQFNMTEDDFQMAIRLADDNVESYMNSNEDEDV